MQDRITFGYSETGDTPSVSLGRFIAQEQRVLFLDGEIENLDFTYEVLDGIDFAANDEIFVRLQQEITGHSGLNRKFIPVYEGYVTRQRGINEMMRVAYELNTTEVDSEHRAERKRQFMRLNIELYGAPERETYLGLVSEAKSVIGGKKLEGKAASLRDELFGQFPESSEAAQRFKPSTETVEWMGEVAESLYGNMLQHVPERKEKFSPSETRDLFEAIIRSEFGDAVKDWDVVLTEEISMISVVASEGTIKIPKNRKPISFTQMRGLVAHELGVHMLRAQMGAETDLLPMQLGFAGYYDAEEGLGKVMEQAVNGEFADAGIPPYLVGSMMFHEQKSSRETFETLWRYFALSSLKTADITDDAVYKARDHAYRILQRVACVPGGLPWFKDLSYYNGNMKIWEHLEKIQGDDTLFAFLFMGRADATNIDHRRVMLETRAI